MPLLAAAVGDQHLAEPAGHLGEPEHAADRNRIGWADLGPDAAPAKPHQQGPSRRGRTPQAAARGWPAQLAEYAPRTIRGARGQSRGSTSTSTITPAA